MSFSRGNMWYVATPICTMRQSNHMKVKGGILGAGGHPCWSPRTGSFFLAGCSVQNIRNPHIRALLGEISLVRIGYSVICKTRMLFADVVYFPTQLTAHSSSPLPQEAVDTIGTRQTQILISILLHPRHFLPLLLEDHPLLEPSHYRDPGSSETGLSLIFGTP
jgi:hypothetical protein